MLVISKNISNPFPQINGLAIGCVGVAQAPTTTNYHANYSISNLSLICTPVSQILSNFRQTKVCSLSAIVGRITLPLSFSFLPTLQLFGGIN